MVSYNITVILLQIDSLRSPFGLPAAVFLRSAPILPRPAGIAFP
jgi:hypothetical protein